MTGFEISGGQQPNPPRPESDTDSPSTKGLPNQEALNEAISETKTSPDSASAIDVKITIIKSEGAEALPIEGTRLASQKAGVLPLVETKEGETDSDTASLTSSEEKVETATSHVLSNSSASQEATHKRLGEGHSVLAITSSEGEKVWTIVKNVLAKGSFKKIKKALCENQTAAYASIALINIPEKGMTAEKIERDTLREIQVSRDCACDQVVQVKAVTTYQAKKDPDTRKMGLLMEYCEGGSLVSALTHMSNARSLEPTNKAGKLSDIIDEAEVLEADLDPTLLQAFLNGKREENYFNLLGDSLLGLSHIHEKGYVHRDIKTDNILVAFSEDSEGRTELHSKIADFGFARQTDEIRQEYLEGKRSVPGTPQFFSPETIKSLPDLDSPDPKKRGAALDSLSSPKGDVWALGISFYEMMMGDYPPWLNLPVFGDDSIIEVVPALDLETVKNQCEFTDEALEKANAYITQCELEGFESALPLCDTLECLNLLMLCPTEKNRPSSEECSQIFQLLKSSGNLEGILT